MTSPGPSAGPSRRRVAGLALVGVGIIAAIIGLASLALDGPDGPAIAAPGGTPTATADPGAPTTTGPPTVPTDPGGVTVPTFPTATAGVGAPPGVGQPGAGQPGAGQPGAPGTGGAPGSGGTGGSGDAAAGGSGGGSGAARGPIRVYNNSNVSGLADKAAADFSARGWQVDEVANYPFGIISETTVYYRPGTGEQAEAEALGQEFGLRVHERFEGLNEATPGVIVIVAREYPA